MRNSRVRTTCVLGLALLAGAARAAGPASLDDSGATAARLTQLQSETVLLQAQLKKLETQQQVIERTAQLARVLGGGAPPAGQFTVTAIEGVGKRAFATLRMNGGAEFEVQRGDALPDGGRVVAIEPRAVVVSNRGRTMRLSTASPSSSYAGNPPLPADAAPPLPTQPTLPASGS
ncbi:pilus assembly protein PilP [Burkholderia stagnalis]|uniref:type IV pilus biogenesis protein PilP n=1 Tax=Burkholderia stagnalis TaxID=1503054 RepID=UPI000755D0D7|nr:type IV pilus biogenesis protein PilP [Burkholderia stagnalis]KVD96286.1 pilus assembly protein PilP [Burkholderia stagnalis]KVO55479.1 pilus assembly protein PilP [Burkholderia stagnalis]KVP13498.1 pilus assembly protein PilP [Burkholderia stagnalis]KVW90584.1 pilus assembly protein PilP [Burkholderia stagnalis]KWH78358.1 pilus assembly protein PilP [Burkholderia stagnalis]